METQAQKQSTFARMPATPRMRRGERSFTMGILDNLNEMANKGAAAASGVLNMGTAAATRAADAASLRVKQNDAERRWKEAASQLGDSLYETAINDVSLASGREEILDAMKAIAGERAQIAADIARIEAETAAARAEWQASHGPSDYRCSACGEKIPPESSFCLHCGAAVKGDQPLSGEPIPVEGVESDAAAAAYGTEGEEVLNQEADAAIEAPEEGEASEAAPIATDEA